MRFIVNKSRLHDIVVKAEPVANVLPSGERTDTKLDDTRNGKIRHVAKS